MGLIEVLLSLFLTTILSLSLIQAELQLYQVFLRLEQETWLGFLTQEACFAASALQDSWIQMHWKEKVNQLLAQGQGEFLRVQEGAQVILHIQSQGHVYERHSSCEAGI